MRLQYLLLCQMQDALQRLPSQQREAYEDALINAPSVVQTESNPLHFLRAEGGNTAAAAIRLCRYWQERKRAFGQRALLPILRVGGAPHGAGAAASSVPPADQQWQKLQFQPGDAFEAQDVPAIVQQQASGAVMLPLPDTTGCSVLFFDPSRISDALVERSDFRLRALFYTLHCLAQNPHSQTQGIVVIARLFMSMNSSTTGGARKSHPSLDTMHDILSALICHVLPLSGVKSLHLVACLNTTAASASASSRAAGAAGIGMMTMMDDTAATSMWIQRVLPMRQAQWETSFRHKPAVLHIAARSANLAGMLQAHGLVTASLPETLGGSWRQQQQYEQEQQQHEEVLQDSDDSANKKPAASSRKRPALSSSFVLSPALPDALHARMAASASSEEEGLGGAAAAFRQQQQQQQQQIMAAAAAATGASAAPLCDESKDVLFHDTPTMRQLGLARLRGAMLSLPDEKRAAYFEAMVICPDLVQTESDPIRFLRFEQYNAWAAARRLARYWEKRKEIFGGHRAFLPLTMTGDPLFDEAFTPEDIAAVETGYIFFLPQDMQGRTVLCYDASRRVVHSADSRKRITFYYASILCENDMTQRDGWILLMPLGMASFAVNPFDSTLKDCVDIYLECFPGKVKNIHLVHYLPESAAGRRRSLLEMVMPMLLTAMGRLLNDREKTVLHPTESREEILTSFARFGLRDQGLPISSGGTYGHDNFYTWRMKRRDEERERYGLMVGRQYHQNEGSFEIPQVNIDHHQANMASAVLDQPTLLERLLGSNHPQVVQTSMMESRRPATSPSSLFASAAAAALTGRTLATSQQASVSPAAVASSLVLPAATLSDNVSMVASSHQAQQAMAHIDYMIRRLPDPEKAAYCEAMRRAPHLVEKESNPAAFGSAAAARRIAMYWTIRKELFGSTNAFLPMTQTGEGALGRSDLIALSTGYFVLVPTKKNRQVLLCYDASKVDSKTDRQCRMRVAFYLLSIASERRCSTTTQDQPGGGVLGGGGGVTVPNGFVIIAHGLAAHQQQRDKEDLERILDVMPGQVHAIHILTLESGEAATNNNNNEDVESAVTGMRLKFGRYGNEKGIVHRGTTRDQVCEQLKPYGLFREWLPKTLGGTFGYDRFVQWQELRTRYEWGLPAGAKDEEAVDVYDFSTVQPLSALSEADRKERKRRMNVVHSRRKRERERIEIEVLQEQCLELRDAHKGLRTQNEHLQALFARVDACLGVAGHGATSGTAASNSSP